VERQAGKEKEMKTDQVEVNRMVNRVGALGLRVIVRC
jgi:hypothetical protein